MRCAGDDYTCIAPRSAAVYILCDAGHAWHLLCTFGTRRSTDRIPSHAGDVIRYAFVSPNLSTPVHHISHMCTSCVRHRAVLEATADQEPAAVLDSWLAPRSTEDAVAKGGENDHRNEGTSCVGAGGGGYKRLVEEVYCGGGLVGLVPLLDVSRLQKQWLWSGGAPLTWSRATNTDLTHFSSQSTEPGHNS